MLSPRQQFQYTFCPYAGLGNMGWAEFKRQIQQRNKPELQTSTKNESKQTQTKTDFEEIVQRVQKLEMLQRRYEEERQKYNAKSEVAKFKKPSIVVSTEIIQKETQINTTPIGFVEWPKQISLNLPIPAVSKSIELQPKRPLFQTNSIQSRDINSEVPIYDQASSIYKTLSVVEVSSRIEDTQAIQLNFPPLLLRVDIEGSFNPYEILNFEQNFRLQYQQVQNKSLLVNVEDVFGSQQHNYYVMQVESVWEFDQSILQVLQAQFQTYMINPSFLLQNEELDDELVNFGFVVQSVLNNYRFIQGLQERIQNKNSIIEYLNQNQLQVHMSSAIFQNEDVLQREALRIQQQLDIVCQMFGNDTVSTLIRKRVRITSCLCAGHHWFGMAHQINRIRVFDSLNSSLPNIDCFIRAIFKLSSHKCDVEKQQMVQQRNSVDCGVYIVKAALGNYQFSECDAQSLRLAILMIVLYAGHER